MLQSVNMWPLILFIPRESSESYFSLITGNGALGNVDPFSFTDEAGGILHGPAIVGDANYLNEGDVVKMDYKANIFNSVRGDWYHLLLT